jgi:hypothetical protein
MQSYQAFFYTLRLLCDVKRCQSKFSFVSILAALNKQKNKAWDYLNCFLQQQKSVSAAECSYTGAD